jgi:tyrosine-protein kinase Etk/Wzc
VLPIIEGRWTVVAITFAALVIAVAYLFVASPTYECTSLVQIEQRRSPLAGLEDLTQTLSGEDQSNAEIEIIRSRMLLGSVVDQLNLAVEARPSTFPVIGDAIARRYVGREPAAAPFRLDRFAWGGERIRIERLNVSNDLVEQRLLLTAAGDGRFSVTAPDGSQLLAGSVTGPAATPSEDPGGRKVELVVSELVARPGTQFFLTRRNREHVIDELQARFTVQQKGRRTGIIVLALEDHDRLGVTATMNAIVSTYLRQNVERKSAEAAKTLEFIESQLPTVKENLDKAERALNSFRVNTGSVDSTAETRAMLERSRDYDRQISELELKRSELRQNFTENHPNLVAVANQLAQLKSERAALAGRMRSLPQAEVNSARLSREVQDATNLYIGLLNKAQELRVVRSGTIGDVRIIDMAHVPDRPASPRRVTTLALALLFGLSGGIAAAILRRSLVRCADTPEEAEAATGLPVYVTIPHSDTQADLSRNRGRHTGALLSSSDPSDIAIESMRSLRTSLQFALVESGNNIVAMTGPAPGVGKSFVALNLANVLAAAGRRVLLVDCDLRRGALHRQLGIDRSPGLSDAVSGQAELDKAVHRVGSTDLYLLPTGKIPPNPAELLSSHRFEVLLRQASTRFDLVIADTPPLLAVSDAMLVARFAGVNFLVLRAGMHTPREIALAVKQFALNGIKLHGNVLNDVRATAGGRYGSGGYVRYDYTSDASD